MSSVNNKKIAKNTIYLYLRMLIVMGIGLYTVRAVLDILGVVDYGIYNVVGGVVGMFAFMNRTLSTSSQRYFSIALAKNDSAELHRTFCLNFSSFAFIGLIALFILETVGLWFVNYKMVIPDDRMLAANVVYQLSVISLLLIIVSVPYIALVIAHERMRFIAAIGIVEAVFKLIAVFLLKAILFDKLIIYGILIFLIELGKMMWYILYCYKHFPESRYRWYWNKSEALELFGFSGWHFLGTFSTTCRSQGINILLNLFFNPAVNAARAVAFQVYRAVNQLTSNFFVAVKPQIYKSYANEQYEDLFKLIMRSTIICSFLISLMAFPFISNTGLILGWWLKDVPDYAIIFTQLVLINGLIDSVDGPVIVPALATGKIRKYMLVVSSIILANIPISYVALLLGCKPQVTMMISIGLSIIAVVIRAYLLKTMMGFPLGKYMSLITKIWGVSFLLLLGIRFLAYNKATGLVSLVLWSVLIIVFLILFYACILSKDDRQFVVSFIKEKVLKKNRKLK